MPAPAAFSVAAALCALAPVASDRLTLGNLLSFLFVDLPVDEPLAQELDTSSLFPDAATLHLSGGREILGTSRWCSRTTRCIRT